MSKIVVNNVEREATCSEELMAMRDCLDILGGKSKLMILRYLTNREHQKKDLEIYLQITRTVED